MVNERIRKIREQNRITQSELAKKLGITRASVNAWEMGVAMPSVGHLVEMVKLFNTSADYLLGVEQGQMLSLRNLSDDEREIMLMMMTYFEKRHQSDATG